MKKREKNMKPQRAQINTLYSQKEHPHLKFSQVLRPDRITCSKRESVKSNLPTQLKLSIRSVQRIQRNTLYSQKEYPHLKFSQVLRPDRITCSKRESVRSELPTQFKLSIRSVQRTQRNTLYSQKEYPHLKFSQVLRPNRMQQT